MRQLFNFLFRVGDEVRPVFDASLGISGNNHSHQLAARNRIPQAKLCFDEHLDLLPIQHKLMGFPRNIFSSNELPWRHKALTLLSWSSYSTLHG